ncbi:hypothetical protein MFIFM68171_10105 [Madurella fahalii]|uniref:NACHT domain-containing protein n=1 Tax=Madurella fahalii TaxID=1157608 RepID=A0ABQ0GQ80_9PEZI
MAEVIAAIAVAGNVLQFLEAGTKFTSKAYDIISRSGVLPRSLEELRQISIDLQAILQKLGDPTKSRNLGSGTQPDDSLAVLAASCSKLIRELLDRLAKTGVGDGKQRLDAVLSAFRAIWHADAINDLRERIDRYRSELATHLLAELRIITAQTVVQQESILSELRHLRSEVKAARNTKDAKLEAPGNVLIYYLSSFLATIGDAGNNLERLQSNMLQEMQSSRGNMALEISPPKKQELQRLYIQTFEYDDLSYRESTITNAYKDTFKWMFQHTPERRNACFMEWLESDSPLFWITGKAGSGKSTLMKYVADFQGGSLGADQCRQHLEKWANGRRLIFASFYFWASGTAEQASARGLYQSLLFQLLQESPDIIPRIVPGEWESAYLFGCNFKPKSNSNLQKLLISAVREITEGGASVCLFIDGLDEFDGDHTSLLSLTHDILKINHVKVCVSSRPWVVFEDAFGQAANLRLQDLTYPDIKLYVESEFTKDQGFKRLQAREPTYATALLEEIVNKSAGVFLWVTLVVRALLSCMSHDDRISDLKRKLDLLPEDLENLYAAILESLDPFYFEHASQYIRLVLSSETPPDALLVSFVDDSVEDPDFAIRLSIQPIDSESIKTKAETLRRRLNSRCKGLLELGPEPHYRVELLHKTVRDFIKKPEVSRRMHDASKDFDLNLQLCSAYLALLKTYNSHASLTV